MKYTNLLFTPVLFNVQEIPIPEIAVTNEQPWYSPYWNFEQLLDNPKPYHGPNEWRHDLDDYRVFLKNLVLQLPLTELFNVRFTVQTTEVKVHVDVNSRDTPADEFKRYQFSEPCGYRFVLKGSTDALKIVKGIDTVTARIPSVPCLYLINSTTGLHSVSDDPGRITLYIRGHVDSLKHQSLIERSLEAYSEYAIWTDQ